MSLLHFIGTPKCQVLRAGAGECHLGGGGVGMVVERVAGSGPCAFPVELLNWRGFLRIHYISTFTSRTWTKHRILVKIRDGQGRGKEARFIYPRDFLIET